MKPSNILQYPQSSLGYPIDINQMKLLLSQSFCSLLQMQYIKHHLHRLSVINKYSIYSLLINQWYHQQQQIITYQFKYISEKIAFQMHYVDKQQFLVQEIMQILGEYKLKQALLISGCLMMVTGQKYKFITHNLLQFNIASYIIKQIVNLKCTFHPYQITKSTSLCNFIRQWYSSDVSSYDTLMSIILKSREDKSIQRSAAAAITILNMVGYKFSNMNLSGISIPNADLTSGYFQNTDLSDSNLKNVIFNNSRCIGTKFNRSDMRGVTFDLSTYNFSQKIRLMDIDEINKKIIFVGFNGLIRIYEIKTMKKLQQWKTGLKNISTINFSADGKRFIYTHTYFIKIINIQSGQIIKIQQDYLNNINCLVYSSNSDTFATGSIDKKIKIWNQQTYCEIISLKGHNDWVWTICYIQNDTKIISGSKDTTIKIWEVVTGINLVTLYGHTNIVLSIKTISDNRIMSCSLDNFFIWNIQTGFRQKTIKVPTNFIYCIDYFQENKVIISMYKQLSIWDFDSKHNIQVLQKQNEYLALAFTHDKKYLIGGSDKKIQIWSSSCLHHPTNSQCLQLRNIESENIIAFESIFNFL